MKGSGGRVSMTRPVLTRGLSVSKVSQIGMPKQPNPESAVQSGAFKAFIAEKGLRATRQRMAVFEAARSIQGHYTAEDLLKKARSLDRSVSRATIYRALPLLVGSNVIREMDVGRDQKYYLAEAGSATFRAQLICENCDSIVEVDAPFMEWYGKAVAAKHGMRPLSQKLQVTAACLNDRCPRRKPARS
jgi:Fur family ferric uptake transcriptional regulator